MSANSGLKYRPDIDGLRAIAVGAVLLYHTFPERVRGGFVGVDVFFVISGFLISGILFRSLHEHRTFSFWEFYKKRVLRIFPALTLVLSVTLVFGWFVLLDYEYGELGKHVKAGAAFYSNFLLSREAGYFDRAAELKPLLHLWSLAIEEQFYLLWPGLIFLFWKLKWQRFWVILSMLALSFLLNLSILPDNATNAFYWPVTRFWEILVGALLAHLFQTKRPPFKTLRAQNWASATGIFFIVFALAKLEKSFAFPGWWAILPTVGTFLVIAAGPQAILNRTVLSQRRLVLLGLISYPLYLWHWPILTFARLITVSGKIPPSLLYPSILVNIGLAWLTYHYVEQPVRHGKFLNQKTAGLCTLMVILGLFGAWSAKNGGFPGRAVMRNVKNYKVVFTWQNSCSFLTGILYTDDFCNRGTDFSTPKVVMIGDSFCGAYYPMVRRFALSKGLRFTQFGRGQCPFLLDYGPEPCTVIAELARNYILTTASVKTVVISADWADYFHGKKWTVWNTHRESAKAFAQALEKTIGYYESIGKRVALLLSAPKGTDANSCRKRKNCTLNLKIARENEKNYRELLASVLKKHPDVRSFDPFAYLCDHESCKVTDGVFFYYVDGKGHLSDTAGEFLSRQAENELMSLLNTRTAAPK